MALLYRGISGSQIVYWNEGQSIPVGVTNPTLVGNINTITSSVVTVVTNSWFNIYSVDFTSLATGSVGTNGLYSINGVNWDRINNANASYMYLSGANKGLEIKVNANNGDYWTTTRTAPGFILPLKNIPELSASYSNPALYDLRVIVQCTSSNNNQASETVVVALERSASLPSTQFIAMEHAFDGNINTNKISASVATGGQTVFGRGETVFVYTLNNHNTIYCGITHSAQGLANISSSFDEINLSDNRLARWEWNSYNYSNGVSPVAANYAAYNLALIVKTGAVSKDIYGNFYRVYVQARQKI